MKTFLIAGAIVNSEDEAWSFEDVTPTQVKSFLDGLEPNEEAVFEINSPGGSCSAGLSICNLIKEARLNGHKVTAHVIGLAASIASVIACSGDELQIDSNAFIMIHLPYSNITGNSVELTEYVSLLKKWEQAVTSVYKTKFDLTEEQIFELMKDETWFMGTEIETYKLNATVIETDGEFKVAACIKNIEKDFKKIPNKLQNLYKDIEMTKKNTKEQSDNTVQDTISSEPIVENKETQNEEKPVETPVEDKTEVQMVSLEECEKRVSGMQSTMAKQVNDLKVQLEAKIKELDTVKNESISLKESLDTATNELQKTVSALEAKEKALETLNANVNSIPEELPTMEEGLAKCKTPSEKVAFLKSGKYKRN